MKHAPVKERDQVAVTLTCEQYADLVDTLDAIAGDLEDLTKLEAAVNAFRDRRSLHTPLEDILHELQGESAAKAPWLKQAKYKHQDVLGLIAHVRKTLAREPEGRPDMENGENSVTSPNCAA
jgi:hypothetical protein